MCQINWHHRAEPFKPVKPPKMARVVILKRVNTLDKANVHWGSVKVYWKRKCFTSGCLPSIKNAVAWVPQLQDGPMAYLLIWGELAQLAGLTWLMSYFLEIFSLCLPLVADLFATLRLRGRPGRDSCQSALWDCFGGRIFNMATNSSLRTVPQCTLTTISTRSPAQPQSGE